MTTPSGLLVIRIILALINGRGLLIKIVKFLPKKLMINSKFEIQQ